jgi:hypothetical protein
MQALFSLNYFIYFIDKPSSIGENVVTQGGKPKQQTGITIMQDFKSFYSILKSVMVDKAKEGHKPSLDNKASMAAYAKAVRVSGRATFGIPQAGTIDYV